MDGLVVTSGAQVKRDAVVVRIDQADPARLGPIQRRKARVVQRRVVAGHPAAVARTQGQRDVVLQVLTTVKRAVSPRGHRSPGDADRNPDRIHPVQLRRIGQSQVSRRVVQCQHVLPGSRILNDPGEGRASVYGQCANVIPFLDRIAEGQDRIREAAIAFQWSRQGRIVSPSGPGPDSQSDTVRIRNVQGFRGIKPNFHRSPNAQNFRVVADCCVVQQRLAIVLKLDAPVVCLEEQAVCDVVISGAIGAHQGHVQLEALIPVAVTVRSQRRRRHRHRLRHVPVFRSERQRRVVQAARPGERQAEGDRTNRAAVQRNLVGVLLDRRIGRGSHSHPALVIIGGEDPDGSLQILVTQVIGLRVAEQELFVLIRLRKARIVVTSLLNVIIQGADRDGLWCTPGLSREGEVQRGFVVSAAENGGLLVGQQPNPFMSEGLKERGVDHALQLDRDVVRRLSLQADLKGCAV